MPQRQTLCELGINPIAEFGNSNTKCVEKLAKWALPALTGGMPLIGEYGPSTSAWARKHAEMYEASWGLEGGDLQGKPVVVLTSIGAVTAMVRKTVVMRVEHAGRYAVVASLGGSDRHPQWYFNLRSNPLVELQDGPTKRDYIARELTDGERAVWWDRAVYAYPPYAQYQRSTERRIPIFVLEPVVYG